MKCMVIAVLAIVGVAQALVPYGVGMDDDDDLGLGGIYGGIGEGYHAGGGRYGDADYAGGRRGYGGAGYGHGIVRAGHNLGHQENDYSQEVHHHEVSDHNVGGVLQAGGHGHDVHGYGAYGRGGRRYGSRFDRGGYGI